MGTFGSAAIGLSDGSFAERLRQLEVPVVVLVGEKSPLPNAAGEETAALLLTVNTPPSQTPAICPGTSSLAALPKLSRE